MHANLRTCLLCRCGWRRQGHPEFEDATVERLLPLLDSRGLVPGRLPPGQDVDAVRASMRAAPLHTRWLAAAAVAHLTQPRQRD